MKSNKERCVFYSFLTLASVLSAWAQTPPPNDNFDNRTVLTGTSVTFSGSLAGATLESAETNTTGLGVSPILIWKEWVADIATGSAWWSWTAPVSSAVVVRMTGALTGGIGFAFYTGTNLSSLTMVSDDWTLIKPAGRYDRFDVVAGTTYHIQVVGSNVQPFSVQIIATNPPVFINQPQDCTVSPYGSAFFSALATGPTPPDVYSPQDRKSTYYQWFFNGSPIPGQIFPSLLVHGVTTNLAGTYSVIASNVGGITQGGSALLTVADTNPVPTLTVRTALNPDSLNFTLTGEPGRWYKIESSTNLQDWANPLWLQLTNPAVPISIQRLTPNHFVRASLDVPTEVCVAQLKQMQWAINVFAIETKKSYGAPCEYGDLFAYVPLGPPFGGPAICPEGGYYWTTVISEPPGCSLQSRGHVLTELP